MERGDRKMCFPAEIPELYEMERAGYAAHTLLFFLRMPLFLWEIPG